MPTIESPTSFQSAPGAIARVRGVIYYLVAAMAVGIGVAVLYAFHAQGRRYTQQLPAPLTLPDKAWFERDLQPPPPPHQNRLRFHSLSPNPHLHDQLHRHANPSRQIPT